MELAWALVTALLGELQRRGQANMSRIAVDRLARQQRRPGPEPGEHSFQAAALIRLATLAASSHNTQPWRFRIDGEVIRIVPDLTRRLPIVDPDEAHLLRSLGCAAENLVHAAAAQGFASCIVPAAECRSLQVELIRDKGLTAGPYYRALRSASGIVVILAAGNTRLDWIRSGMAAQRLLLEAESHDVRTAFFNQAIEAPGVRDSFRSWLGVEGWPMLMIRLGRGPRAPYSLRRPVADVIDFGA